MKKFVGMIDCTPTWESLVPLLVVSIQSREPDRVKVATEELYRLARAVDQMNEEMKLTDDQNEPTAF